MDDRNMILLLAVLIIIIFIGAVAKKLEWLLNFVMRSVLGAIAIFFINNSLAAAGISLGVGINAVSVLTSGILGIPGLLALYGLGIYKQL